jgi:hypothetical protein
MAEGAAGSRAINFPASAAKLRGLEPRAEPGEMVLEMRFLSFVVVTRVLRFLRICLGVLRDVTVPEGSCAPATESATTRTPGKPIGAK